MEINTESWLVNVERIRDCGVLGSKWDMYSPSPFLPIIMEEETERLWKSEAISKQWQNICHTLQSFSARELTAAVTACTRPVQDKAKQSPIMNDRRTHKVPLLDD